MLKLYRFLNKYMEESVVVILLVYLILCVNFEVFRRYVLNASGAYMEEIARLTMISMVYIGIPYAIKKRKHIICNIFGDKISPTADFILNMIGNTFFLIFACIMVFSSFELIDMQIMLKKKTEAMHIPTVYFTGIICLGFTLSFYRLFQNMIADISKFRART